VTVVTSYISEPESTRGSPHVNMTAVWDPRTWACQCSLIKEFKTKCSPVKVGHDMSVGSDLNNSESITVEDMFLLVT